MPELAEVERARRLVEECCLGARVKSVLAAESGGGPRNGMVDTKVLQVLAVKNDDEIAVERILSKRLAKACVKAVLRKGKHFWIDFGTFSLAFHLGMSGNMRVKGKKSLKYRRTVSSEDEVSWPPRYSKLILKFTNNVELAFMCPRRFGRVRMLQNPAMLQSPIRDLGFDPLTEMLGESEFYEAMQARAKPVKAALLDQSFSAGVGNWIVDEVCFQARIHPATPCKRLSKVAAEAVRQSLERVVSFAVECNADHAKFPDTWLFHFRWNKGKNVKYMGKYKIVYSTIGGRTTAIVPHVQKQSNGVSSNLCNSKKEGGSKKRKRKLSAQVKPEKDIISKCRRSKRIAAATIKNECA